LQLSSMLRVILEGVKQPTWPLARELELLSSLFSLHQMRDPELFTWSLSVDDGAKDALVPPLLLLPLGENAMKHGPARGHRGTVSVSVVVDAGSVVVIVENPGAFAGRRDGGEGLAIVEGRASLAGGSVVVETVAGDRTRATLRLPPAVRP
jgi:LytS/YehU family sensor histidine kinase